ncbi:MAG TPA: glycosyltransferase family 39 protein [Anaerolineae bacterium]|nr:glycosyltransferase family 39 protein [Anaerolineae bacterium]
MLSGSEASIGVDASNIAGGFLRNPFSAGWLTNPTLSFYPYAFSIDALGNSIFALRLPSAFIGALTIPLIYLIGQRLWSRPVGLTAALLLLGNHAHLHYSRLGITNIWDPALALLAIGLILNAWHRPSRHGWLLAGLAIGLNAYFFTSLHLFPLILLPLGLILLIKQAQFTPQRHHILAALLLAFIVASPQISYFRQNPEIFMARIEQISPLYNPQLAATVDWPNQFTQSLFAFNHSLDTDTNYLASRPFLSIWPAIFFIFGLAWSLYHGRRLRHLTLFIWILIPIIFGAALIENPPASRRLLIALPAVTLITALGLVTAATQLQTLLARYLHAANINLETDIPYARHLFLATLLITTGLISLLDIQYYLQIYPQENRFGDRNTEIAYELSRFLQEQDPSHPVYFYGAPHMYTSFPTFAYLAPQFRPNVNFFDITTPYELPPNAPQPPFTLVFVPERAYELTEIQTNYSQGTITRPPGRLTNPLFITYQVTAP